MATLKYLSQYFSTTLNVGGGIDASQTTGIILQSVSGVHDITEPGQICVTYSDPIDTSVAEWIDYTSINGSNELVGAVRGREGFSAHTHLQNATVAFVLSASHHNDMVDAVKKVYNETTDTLLKATAAEVATGTDDTKIVTPKSIKDAGIVVTPVKASGAEITTGTDDAKFATAKALADAGVNTRLKSKVIQSSRDLTAAAGAVAYTGVGFTPTSIIAFLAGGADNVDIGVADSARGSYHIIGGSTWTTNAAAIGANLILYSSSGGNYQNATVNSYDADGFTLGWGKVGSPTGTVYITFLCFG